MFNVFGDEGQMVVHPLSSFDRASEAYILC